MATNHYAALMSSTSFEMPHKFRARCLSDHPNDNLDASRSFSLGPRTCLGRGPAMPYVPYSSEPAGATEEASAPGIVVKVVISGWYRPKLLI